MLTTSKLKAQVAIFGGGVAGLWLLNRLQQLDVSCLLIENNQLGGGQTIFSQGIIHSGLKYALSGKLTVSAEAMKQMPDIWRKCLQGEGEIDLSDVAVLSENQYLWSPGSLAANLAVFLASKNLKSQVSCLTKSDYPEAFSAPDFKGSVYMLEEPVLAVKTLVEALAAPYVDCLLQAELQYVEHSDSGSITALHLQNEKEEITVNVDHVILLAGKGNQALAKQFGLTLLKMQLRPLLMVTVTAPHLPVLFAHAMQASDKPRITITSHKDGENYVWYLGGDLAERGVNRTPEAQIIFARKELASLFPHIDFSQARFQTFYIERAEAEYPSGKKPEGPSIIQERNVITAWPTKLAFAPLLAQQIVDKLTAATSVAKMDDEKMACESMMNMKPAIANYPWSQNL